MKDSIQVGLVGGSYVVMAPTIEITIRIIVGILSAAFIIYKWNKERKKP